MGSISENVALDNLPVAEGCMFLDGQAALAGAAAPFDKLWGNCLSRGAF